MQFGMRRCRICRMAANVVWKFSWPIAPIRVLLVELEKWRPNCSDRQTWVLIRLQGSIFKSYKTIWHLYRSQIRHWIVLALSLSLFPFFAAQTWPRPKSAAKKSSPRHVLLPNGLPEFLLRLIPGILKCPFQQLTYLLNMESAPGKFPISLQMIIFPGCSLSAAG